VALVRAELAKYPALQPKLWLDEWNADAGYDARQDGPFDGALVAAVLDNVSGAGLDRMAFFRVADDTKPTLGNWGMLFADGTPKPAYQVYSLWHGLGGGGSLPVDLFPDQSLADPSGRVGAVATRSGQNVSVLIYNFVPYDPTGEYGTGPSTPYDHTVSLVVGGLTPGRLSWTRESVDGARTPAAAGDLTVAPFGHGDADLHVGGRGRLCDSPHPRPVSRLAGAARGASEGPVVRGKPPGVRDAPVLDGWSGTDPAPLPCTES
jgi:hypothetical protein